MNPAEALAYFGWVPSCSCNHDLERHESEGAGPCGGLDSYEQPCECPAYFAEQGESDRIEVA